MNGSIFQGLKDCGAITENLLEDCSIKAGICILFHVQCKLAKCWQHKIQE